MPSPRNDRARRDRIAALLDDRLHAEGPTTPHASASGGAAADETAPGSTALREALGPAIAARVPGVTYEGTGRFRVATRERTLDVTIERVRTGVARVRRGAGDAAVLEIPTGLGDGELAAAVAEQLRALQGQPSAPTSGSGEPLPPDVRADMEGALGADLSAVRIHQNGQAEAMGALAFTRGTDIYFAPGRFDPRSGPGRQLLGHELAHVAQQAQGRVSTTRHINGQAANDDPTLEHEADAKGANAATATGGSAAPRTLAKPAATGPVQAKVAPRDAGASASAQPVTSEPATSEPSSAARGVSDVASVAPIQRQRDDEKAPKQHIAYKIRITEPMTGEQFKVAAHLQMFGAVISSDWHDVQARYTPADSPVEIFVDVKLFRRGRALANAARGIDTDATGGVAGADARAKDFAAQPGSDERAALLAEIDRRYSAASGEAAGVKIQPGDGGHGELWRSIRDEVLFQRAYLAHLPDKVQALIRVGIAGRDLTPADYDQLFRIAKAIERLPPGEAADCASKVTASTTDLGQLEATIERYRSDVAAREQADQDRTAVQNKLLGLEGVYKLYRDYRTASPSEVNSPAYEKSGILKRHGNAPGVGDQLAQQLPRYGFASIDEFAAYISRFERAFEDGATAITLDLLAKYAGKLYRESQRYQDPAVVSDLYGRLAGFRTQHQEFDKNSKILSQERWNAQHERDAEQRRLPGNGGIPAKPPTQTLVEAKRKAEAAQAGAEAQIKDLSTEYPLFAEGDLPSDKRINKVALAQASETQLAGVLQAHIANRQAAVADARGQLEGKHELIYKMPKLLPTFYAQMGIQPGSIHDLIIQDKIHDDAVGKVVEGILLALVALALTVVSFGAATPAVLAAGASIGAAGLSTYMAYDEYQQYTADHAIAEAGFAKDPSVVWLVLAIVGAGVDMGAAVGAVGKLAPAAKLLEADGKLIEFTKAVEALKKSQQIDEKIAAAADKAAAARTSYAAAKDQFKADLKVAAGRAAGALGPFTDPTVARGLVKMAVAKIREGVHSLDAFIGQLKQARIEAQLGEMTPEELVKAKEAWAQAEALANQAKNSPLVDKLLELGFDPATIEKVLQQLPADELLATAEQIFDVFGSRLTPATALELARLPNLDRALLEQLAARGVPVAEQLGQSLAKVTAWSTRARVGLAKLAASDTPDALRLLAKVTPNLDIDGMETWVLLASRQLKQQSRLIDLEQSLDKAIQLRKFNSDVAMEVDYYKGKRVGRDEINEARTEPSFDGKQHSNIDIETGSERWEMKRVNPPVTENAQLVKQVRNGAGKYEEIGLPSLKNGGPKKNIVDVEFGDRIQIPGIDEAGIRQIVQRYLDNNPQVRRYVDAFVLHAELDGASRTIVIEI